MARNSPRMSFTGSSQVVVFRPRHPDRIMDTCPSRGGPPVPVAALPAGTRPGVGPARIFPCGGLAFRWQARPRPEGTDSAGPGMGLCQVEWRAPGHRGGRVDLHGAGLRPAERRSDAHAAGNKSAGAVFSRALWPREDPLAGLSGVRTQAALRRGRHDRSAIEGGERRNSLVIVPGCSGLGAPRACGRRRAAKASGPKHVPETGRAVPVSSKKRAVEACAIIGRMDRSSPGPVGRVGADRRGKAAIRPSLSSVTDLQMGRRRRPSG